MIYMNCPYCGKENNILFSCENLIKNKKSKYKCDSCHKIFEIYNGKEKIESRK